MSARDAGVEERFGNLCSVDKADQEAFVLFESHRTMTNPMYSLEDKQEHRQLPESPTSTPLTPAQEAACADMCSHSSSSLYHPLPFTNSIRLLRLHPGKPSAPIEITFEVVPLDDTLPAYESLSYVWKLKEGHKSITINGHQKDDVGTNLFEALHQLRQAGKSRLLWVDALSINQDDEAEKAQQVKNMHHVYMRAEKVIVWLGTDEQGFAPDAFMVLCALANMQDEDEESGKAGYEAVDEWDGMVVKQLCEVPDLDHPIWMSVFVFITNTWFLRMWVLQEIVLARQARFVWGSASLDWDIFSAAVHAIRADARLHANLECRHLQNAFLMDHLRSEQMAGHGRRNYPFLHLLDVARSLEVTDPRDKVYGLLGFPTRDASLETGLFIVPDYSLSTAEVYADVAKKLLEKDGNLNVLSYVVQGSAGAGNHDLPSWVPDWTCRDVVYPLTGLKEENWHHAGTAKSMDMLPVEDTKRLCLRGAVVDTVRSVGERSIFTKLLDSDSVLKNILEWCMRSGVSIYTMATTLTAGRDAAGHLIGDLNLHLTDFVALMADLGVDLGENQLSNLSHPVAGSRPDRAREALWRFSCHRTPFVTAAGHLGLGPGSIQAGDALVVLWGGQVPFVMRREPGGSWKLIGEAYVHGWMNGEAMAMPDTVFEIT